MAKRKRRRGSGSKLRPIKDYRDDQYVPYIAQAETGILEAWTIDPDLRDGNVREALRALMRTMKKSGALLPELTEAEPEQKSATSLLEWRIIDGLRRGFEQYGPLDVDDTIGILSVINNSVGAWNRGMMGQEYLKYIKNFLGGMGVEVRQLTDEESLELGLPLTSELNDDDDSIEGDYREI